MKKVGSHLNLGVIVTARMTSSRFPGKHLAVVHGKPVLQWCLERCMKIHKNARVILAVPDKDESEPLLELAHELGVANFCGDEFDVLKRMYDAAMFFELDVIIRITGDCPFIDPNVCQEILNLLMFRRLDYASNICPRRTYPQGLDCEAFTMDCLEATHKLAKTDYDREHVTSWMQKEKAVNKGNIEHQIDLSHKNYCVDYPEDIARLEKEITLVKQGTPLQIYMPDKRVRVTM